MVRLFDKEIILPCEACGRRPATQKHHKYSQRKWYVKNYGRKNIDDRRNIQYVCDGCGSSHAGQGKGLVVWSEQEFCEALGLTMTSKTARVKELS